MDKVEIGFDVLSNNGAGRPLAGLSEVQFDGTAASATTVPEPVKIFWTLMGLGGGAALKRRLKRIESKSV
ncbi:PEP-CTERM domain protein [Chamaesiphon minutus]|uniref:Uncharacterized protein n=1 Tax=Chamaesiphon minutus (strain ATCC 27169 / PCC 6605) TaxID=1173020 RepID=K9UKI6_CHAP6|nr:PEP-CTERM domain protein [Chamaesiphon minutus]AFY95173.1 hypothetical protein Cha6605_4231 [Chamaesiphon minutus PCC 6605]